ncbi:MAG: DHH family phosphoesterase [Candidatus Aenigmarchaeota archaeon]|nr:DHH family phosphoesterase [Candidatus Aenigmarchaeota archaeon]
MDMDSIINDIRNRDNFIILTHHNADVDAIASSLTMKEILLSMGKKVDVGVAESVSEVARKFLNENDGILIDPSVEGYDTILVVDTSSPEQLMPIEIPESKHKIVIDHHIPGALISGSNSLVIPESTSCSEIIYELSKKLNLNLSSRSMFLLASGIVYDTAHLRNANLKTLKTLVELLERSGHEFKEILSLLSTDIDISEKIAILKSYKRMEAYRIGDVLVAFSHAGSFEASVARNLLRSGADIAIVGAPRKNLIRISGRMKHHLRNKINLAEIFSNIQNIIDGSAGGHDVAASANGKKPENMKKAFNKILRMLEEKLGNKSKTI